MSLDAWETPRRRRGWMFKHKFATRLVLRETHVRCHVDLTGTPILVESGRKRNESLRLSLVEQIPRFLLLCRIRQVPFPTNQWTQKLHRQDSILLEVSVHGLYRKFSAAKRSLPHHRQIDKEPGGAPWAEMQHLYSPLKAGRCMCMTAWPSPSIV